MKKTELIKMIKEELQNEITAAQLAAQDAAADIKPDKFMYNKPGDTVKYYDPKDPLDRKALLQKGVIIRTKTGAGKDYEASDAGVDATSPLGIDDRSTWGQSVADVAGQDRIDEIRKMVKEELRKIGKLKK